jgi:hypothetical protein
MTDLRANTPVQVAARLAMILLRCKIVCPPFAFFVALWLRASPAFSFFSHKATKPQRKQESLDGPDDYDEHV